MKKIIYHDSDFKKESIIIKNGMTKFPENTIFYVKGLLFEPSSSNLSRHDIEIGMKKKYVGELNTAIIADNEKVFLDRFFTYDDHHITDLLHILTYREVQEMNSYINKSEYVSLSEPKGFFKAIFSNLNDEIIVFLNSDSLKERKIERIKYQNISEKEDYIMKKSSEGWEPYFNDDVSHIKSMLKEMNYAMSGDEKYASDFYYYNKANSIYDKLDLGELTEEEKEEVKRWNNEDQRYEDERNKKDIIDSFAENTYNRLTSFKYITEDNR